MLDSCYLEKESLERSFEECQKRFDDIFRRVECLEKVLRSMGEQIQRMLVGSGFTNFPRPIGDDPDDPVQIVCTLNACPLCGSW